MKKIVLSLLALASCVGMASCTTSPQKDRCPHCHNYTDNCGCNSGCGGCCSK